MVEISNVNAFIDCEWGSDGKTICVQVLLTYGKKGCSKYIVFDEKYREFLAEKGYLEGVIPNMGVNLRFDSFSDEKDMLTNLIYNHFDRIGGDYTNRRLKCNFYLFFSPKDLWICIGYNSFLEIMNSLNKNGGFQIEQKRNLFGSFSQHLENSFSIQYKVKDISGWTNRGLKNLSRSLGLSVESKSLLDAYKSRMEVGLVECTDDFIRYAVNDVELLNSIVFKQTELVNWICKDILHMNMKFDHNTIPMTQGSLVSKVFIGYIYSLMFKSSKYPESVKNRLLQTAFYKLGLLKKESKNYRNNFILHKEVFDDSNFDSFFNEKKLGYLDELIEREKGIYENFAYSPASIKSFVKYYGNTTGIFNALVQGGRCVNEHYWARSHEFCGAVSKK